MQRRAKIILALILLAGILIAIYFKVIHGTDQTQKIKIALLLPLTGSVAEWGTPARNAAILAVELFNKTIGDGGKKIEIVAEEDDQCDPAKAVSAVRKLISTGKPIAIIGSICSSCVLAVAPILEENKIILITPGATNPKIADAGDYIFRDIPPDDLRGKKFAEYVYSTGKRKLAALYINNDAGLGNEKAFKDEFTRLGGEIIFGETYNQDSTDMRTQLAKIKAASPDGMLIVSYPMDTSLVMIQAKELQMHCPLYFQTEALDDPAVINRAGDAAEGAFYILSARPEGSAADAFRSAFEKKYGRAPETYAAESYDAVMLIATILNRADKVSSDKLKEGLYATAGYEGASGKITFDAKGEVSKPMAVKQIKNGKPVVIKVME